MSNIEGEGDISYRSIPYLHVEIRLHEYQQLSYYGAETSLRNLRRITLDNLRESTAARMGFHNVTHCIFDMDGLLLDTESLYTLAYNRVTQEYGKTYGWEHKAKIMGCKSTEALQTIIDMLQLPITVQTFEDKLAPIYQEIFPKCDLMPGAEKLLQHLKKKNIPIALATSSSQESSDLKTQKWKYLFDLFNHKVYGGSDPEVIQGKPYPDIFLIAANRFPDNPDPLKCLVFEDSPNGVRAGIAAKMQVVMVPDPQLPKHLTENATLVLGSLEDFKPEDFGLPPFVA